MKYKIDKRPMDGEISDYADEPRLHKVDETEWEKIWNRLVRKYHYLGYAGFVGGRVKYLITLGEYVVGAISFCPAVYRLGPRDEYIGWDEETRLARLANLVNNNRFLILPWVRIKNLASKVLAMSLRRIQPDWEKQYGVRPQMAETFVDREKYPGTCYKASNWMYLGGTKGYARTRESFEYHGQIKDIYVYVMDRQFAKEFRPDISRVKQLMPPKKKKDNTVNQEKEELAAMINGIPMWNKTLLEDVGIDEDFAQKITPLFIDHMAGYTKHVGRKENQKHLIDIVQGFLSEFRRKTLQTIALAYRGADDVRNMTNFMTRSKWEDERLKETYQADLSDIIGAEGGMITGDESGIPKKGKESVGVARQYCGNTGKIDNCQVGVMAGYVSGKGYGIVDYELYMPESWFDDDHSARRKKCGVPSGVSTHRTKNEILSDMIIKTHESGKFPAKYVGVDSGYGRDSKFLDSLPAELIYFADVPYDTRVFTSRPQMFVPEYSGKGRKPVKMKAEASPVSVKAVAYNQNIPWNPVVLGIGAKGPVIAQDKIIPVVEVRDGLPGKDVWLYVRKLENGDLKYALCNAAPDAGANEVRKPALMRWSIEQCFNECKEYLGMDHYETRSWHAWHRHMLLCFISQLFITKLKTLFSSAPDTPSTTPYIEAPVSFADYAHADEQMLGGKPISNPDIMAVPDTSQRFLTIGLLCRLLNRIFIRTGEILKEIDYLLRSARDAFDSHSRNRLDKAKALYASN